ncbi:peptidoglycan editing factor PgeF [Calothrix sp. NIES-3974]|uniref:peptidoglycan editing factor PgeF n=1 Tax=Calothrix sp. NIES-3974 TaxID=2005462 RepID=UPI000B60364D|nr:peptidoglycan editing factor PgeF [Calothrix sp. NIES-3974]BAZ06264.1 hypothetical protein NIES3974_29220 [Calothrix sp. NIES-3974]
MHTWHWRTWENKPYLACSILEKFPHGFFTQHFWQSPPQELTKAFASSMKAYRLKQVHGNRVLTPQQIHENLENGGEHVDDELDPPLVMGDGVMSDASVEGQSVWVASADCTPALIGDIQTGQVTAIHAGWRGTAQKIIPVAIAMMQNHGSRLQDLRIALGPAIAGEVYQVSLETAMEVGATICPAKEPEEMMGMLMDGENPPLLPDPEVGKVRLDVRRINAMQMENMGISPEQIAIAPYCTYQNPEHFFSYRRQREKKVQWSGIASI